MKFFTAKQSVLVLALAPFVLAVTPALAFADEGQGGGVALLIPTLAELIPAAIAFLIIFIVLSKFVWPAVVKMMADREEHIAEGFKASDEAREKAKAIEQEAEDVLARARDEAGDIVARAKREAEDERTRIVAEAKIEAAETIEKGHAAVESERKRARSELSKSVVDLSVEIASRIIGNDLNDETHRALVERYLSEMGSDDAE